MKANFNDYFWVRSGIGTKLTLLSVNDSDSKRNCLLYIPQGTDCRGFDVLLKNLKSSVTASHQLGEYIKERSAVEFL